MKPHFKVCYIHMHSSHLLTQPIFINYMTVYDVMYRNSASVSHQCVCACGLVYLFSLISSFTCYLYTIAASCIGYINFVRKACDNEISVHYYYYDQ